MRSSLGPGVGVGRWVTSNSAPFEGRIVARWWPEGMEDIMGLIDFQGKIEEKKKNR